MYLIRELNGQPWESRKANSVSLSSVGGTYNSLQRRGNWEGSKAQRKACTKTAVSDPRCSGHLRSRVLKCRRFARVARHGRSYRHGGTLGLN